MELTQGVRVVRCWPQCGPKMLKWGCCAAYVALQVGRRVRCSAILQCIRGIYVAAALWNLSAARASIRIYMWAAVYTCEQPYIHASSQLYMRAAEYTCEQPYVLGSNRIYIRATGYIHTSSRTYRRVMRPWKFVNYITKKLT